MIIDHIHIVNGKVHARLRCKDCKQVMIGATLDYINQRIIEYPSIDAMKIAYDCVCRQPQLAGN